MYRLHSHCRACGYARKASPDYIKKEGSVEKLMEILDLGIQPLANDFKKYTDEHAGYAPLKLLMCPRCGLAQLSVVVEPAILYKDYPYVTSRSATMENHFSMLLHAIRLETQPLNCIEIGSNDGHFLEFCQNHNVLKVFGIDPAENLATAANESMIRTVVGEFNKRTAEVAMSNIPCPDLVVARHVFCHINEWNLFMVDLERLASEERFLAVIEVPYALDMIANGSFDQVYHEHLSYLHVGAMAHLLEHTPFKIQRVEHFPIHGGSIAIMIRRKDWPHPPHESVQRCIQREESIQGKWLEFAAKSSALMCSLESQVINAKQLGKSVCGYGASAKSTVFLNACGFKRKDIQFICDSTKQKQGRLSPGSDIPIVDEGALLRELPDYAVIFAHNFASEIIQKNERYVELGGKWIVPVPECKVLP